MLKNKYIKQFIGKPEKTKKQEKIEEIQSLIPENWKIEFESLLSTINTGAGALGGALGSTAPQWSYKTVDFNNQINNQINNQSWRTINNTNQIQSLSTWPSPPVDQDAYLARKFHPSGDGAFFPC